MRVISGIHKGRKLFSPLSETARPTLDRVKETIFNILQFKLKKAVVLDLFSGSGALGIEALSRGAEKVVFCDNGAESCELTKKNLLHIGAENFQVKEMSFQKALQSFASNSFDVVLLDPPFESEFGPTAIGMISQLNLLKDDGVIVWECKTATLVPQQIEKLYLTDLRKVGKVSLAFFKKEETKQ